MTFGSTRFVFSQHIFKNKVTSAKLNTILTIELKFVTRANI